MHPLWMHRERGLAMPESGFIVDERGKGTRRNIWLYVKAKTHNVCLGGPQPRVPVGFLVCHQEDIPFLVAESLCEWLL